MHEQLRKLMLTMHPLSLLLQRIIKIAKNEDTNIIEVPSISTPNHISSPIIKHPSNIKEPRVILSEKFVLNKNNKQDTSK